MNDYAENALLKTLEEPPASSVFDPTHIEHPSVAPNDTFSMPNSTIPPHADTRISRNLSGKIFSRTRASHTLAIAADGAIGKALTQLEKGDALSEEVARNSQGKQIRWLLSDSLSTSKIILKL